MKDHDPTPDEILYAQGKKPFDPLVQAKYLKTFNVKAARIKEAFARQQEAAVGFFFCWTYIYISNWCFQELWDLKRFEGLLTCWIIACDQPFDEVEKLEFIEMMQYGHQAVLNFTLPKQEGVQWYVMKLGKKTIDDIKEIFCC